MGTKRKSKKPNPSITLKRSDIEKLKKEVSKEVTANFLTLILSVLHDKEGYGRKRLQRVYNNTIELSDMINEGYVSIGNLQKILLDELNVKIITGKGE